MRKLSIDDTVYIIDGSRIKKAKIEGIKKKWFRGIFVSHKEIVYEILGKEYQAEEIYETKSEVFLKLIEVLVFEDKKMNEDKRTFMKLKNVCRYLFPEEFEDELEDKDFESTGREEVLRIEKPRGGISYGTQTTERHIQD